MHKNVFAGAIWWRSQQEIQYWMNESRKYYKQHDTASSENESLQEAIISEKVPSLKLSALSTHAALAKAALTMRRQA
jgi:hypothetical protein